MRISLILINILFLNLLAISVTNAEEPVPQTTKKNAIIVKAGTFTLAKTEQTIISFDATFDDNSTSVFAVEYTRKFGDNFTFGGEILHYQNQYAMLSIPGEVETVVFTGNIKKYFDLAKYFQPFIGAGLGVATTNVTGALDGSASGLAASFSVGAEIPFEYVGIHLEYKYLSATTDGETTGGDTAKFDVGGSGLFAGVSIHF